MGGARYALGEAALRNALAIREVQTPIHTYVRACVQVCVRACVRICALVCVCVHEWKESQELGTGCTHVALTEINHYCKPCVHVHTYIRTHQGHLSLCLSIRVLLRVCAQAILGPQHPMIAQTLEHLARLYGPTKKNRIHNMP